MAPLYKRYVPPKQSAAQTPPTDEPAPKNDPIPIPRDAPTKRKRERTEDEVAERKAKKLKKRGVNPATVEQAGAPTGGKQTGKNIPPVVDRPVRDVPHEPHGEFAHIKNAKKRHKLEKEARKAKKAAGPDLNKANADDGDPVHARIMLDPAPTEPQPPKVQSEHDTVSSSKDRRGRYAEDQNGLSVDEVEAQNFDPTTKDWKPKKIKKKDRKDVAAESATGTTAAVTATTNGHDAAQSPENELDAKTPKLKKRRHRLEAVLNGEHNEPSDPPAELDDHLRKHAGIMSKFSESQKLSETAPQQPVDENLQDKPPPVLRDLIPLPQPDKAPTPEFIPDPATVPSWLARPTIVSNTRGCRFDDLKIEPKLVQQLANLGFENALPVQQALIPLLLPPGASGARFLPGTKSVLPDIAVGAPTGSGKTIAYLLPMIESIKKTAGLGRLKALVVVPTRELVMQVAAVADSLSRGSGIKVGIATGMGSFKDEQTRLIKCGRQYDPHEYRELLAQAHRQNYPPREDSEGGKGYLDEVEYADARQEKRVQTAVSTLVDHVPTFESAADILVATPGRLLEHLDNTLGFSLAYLEWLVLDEADKLVDSQYDGFLEAVNNELSRPRQEQQQDARECYLRAKGAWNEHLERCIRKVVLSATMTRDISKLVELKLKRPQLVLVQSESSAALNIIEGAEDGQPANVSGQNLVHEFELPPTLLEYCVPVGDGSEKPLHLIEIFEKRLLGSVGRASELQSRDAAIDTVSDSSSSSDSDSELSSDLSSSSDETAGSEMSSDGEDNETGHHGAHDANGIDSSVPDANIETAVHPDRAAMLDRLSIRSKATSTIPVVLVFVSSTESANRLAHLLEIMKPDWASFIRTMTRTDSQKAVSSLTANQPSIIISTDRAARGLDSIANRSITHVVQYDVPRSATGYIHRVGRTARAGRRGEAWTLYTHSEARWFYKGICKSESIKRAEAVEKVKFVLENETRREDLATAVAEMRDEVHSNSHRKSK